MLAADEGLKDFQKQNCTGCFFADDDKVGTGEPCCTKPTQIEAKEGICQSKKPRGKKG
jgi:hypothetical protein